MSRDRVLIDIPTQGSEHAPHELHRPDVVESEFHFINVKYNEMVKSENKNKN